MSGWAKFVEADLNARLSKHGYELHEQGWETKLMKLKARSETKSKKKKDLLLF